MLARLHRGAPTQNLENNPMQSRMGVRWNPERRPRRAAFLFVRDHHICLNRQRRRHRHVTVPGRQLCGSQRLRLPARHMVQGRRRPAPHLPVKCRDREGKKAVARPPFSCPPLVTGCPLGVLQQIITRFRSSTSKGNPFDCALAHAVRSERWALGSSPCWKLLLRSSAL